MKLTHLLTFVSFLIYANGALLGQDPIVISIVYDNSGSMNANDEVPCDAVKYSTQLLTNLLDRDDNLFVTLTSEPNNTKEVEVKGDKGIAMIKAFDCSGKTPFAAVRTARDVLPPKLEGKGQPWLVLLSDGEFQNPDHRIIEEFPELTNGGNLGIFQIGGEKNKGLRKAIKRAGGKEYLADLDQQSIQNQLGALYSNMLGIPAEGLGDRLEFRGNTVSFFNDLPLYEIVVLYQGSKDGVGIDLEQVTLGNIELGIDKLEPIDGQGQLNLRGQMYKIKPSRGDLIGPGKMTFNFTSTASKKNLVVLPKVAVRIEAFPDTTEVIERTGIHYRYGVEQVKVFSRIVSVNQDLSLDDAIFKNTRVVLRSIGGEYEMKLNNGIFEVSIPVKKEEIKYTVEATLPNYFQKISNIFSVSKAECDPCEITLVSSVEKINTTFDDFRDSPDKFEIIPLISNKPLPAALEGNFRLVQKDDTGIKATINPVRNKWEVQLKSSLLRCCQPTPQNGKLVFVAEADGSTRGVKPSSIEIPILISEEPFFSKWIGCILGLLGLLLLVWYLYRLSNKKRFQKGAYMEIIRKRDNRIIGTPTRKYLSPSGFGNYITRWLWPSKREKSRIEGVIFYANSKKKVDVLVSSVPEDGIIARERVKEILDRNPGIKEKTLLTTQFIEKRNRKEITTLTFKKKR